MMKGIYIVLLLTLHLYTFAQPSSASGDTLPLTQRNYVGLQGEYAHFSKDLKAWKTVALESQLLHKSWVFLPKLSYSERFEQKAWFTELDLYKKCVNKDYFYLKGAYSASEVFAHRRFDAEYFNTFAKVWEHSVGLKYMHYNGNIDVSLLTASLSKYSGKYYTLLRANLGVQNSITPNILSASIQQRYYHSDLAFSAVNISYGFDPSAVILNGNTTTAVAQNKTFSLRVSTQQAIGSRFFLEARADMIKYTFVSNQRSQFLYSLKLMYTWW